MTNGDLDAPRGTETPVGEVSFRQFPLWRRGKVRDVFDAGDRFLFVATDRVSAFDVVLPTLIPGKGKILTDISQFWFKSTQHLCPNHVLAFDTEGLELEQSEVDVLQGRTMQVAKADRIDVECVVRAHLAGSGWSEYQDTGTLAGKPLPDGLSIGDRLPELRFTPATKNDNGHDVNISRAELAARIGHDLAAQLEQLSKVIFNHASDIAREAGFVLADSKFEFGFIDEQLALIDEVLTPDSSRYWDATTLNPGIAPPGYDKQVIRDWLTSTGWDKEPPAPDLPAEISQTATTRYETVRDRLLRANAGAQHLGATRT